MSLARQKPFIALLSSLTAFTILLTPPNPNNATSLERECKDTNDNCIFWASNGECEANPGYMHVHCPLSCAACRSAAVVDGGELASLTDEVAKYGERQKVEGEQAAATLRVIRRTIRYMRTTLPNLPPEIARECINREDLCAFWSAIGECTDNPEFMSQNCGPSCQNCGVEIVSTCPPPGAVPALAPGGLNHLFERIVANAPGNTTNSGVGEGTTNYTVRVHSRPGRSDGREIVDADAQFEMQRDPWIVALGNFLTEGECAALIELGRKVGYSQSYDAVQVLPDGSYSSSERQGRTLSTAWCDYHSNCRAEDIPQRVHERIAKLTGIMVGNSEDLQIVKYEHGQFYNTHHDFVDAQQNRRCGPRILTFVLYLSDVEEGGETSFPYFGITVKPRVGGALLFANVFDSDLKKKDERMAHEAKTVIKGQKFVANAWLHLYEYVDLPCGV